MQIADMKAKWSRTLTAEEVTALSADPYQFLVPADTDDSEHDQWPAQVVQMTELLLPFVREWLDTMGNNYASAFGINYAMEEAVRKVLRERGVRPYESRGE